MDEAYPCPEEFFSVACSETATAARCQASGLRHWARPLRRSWCSRYISRSVRWETGEFGPGRIERFGRSRNGSFEFDQLSAGAKQQLSALTRLATARLICQERPHPVFSGDVLSDTDPKRVEAIANILRSAAREMRIIMTTCHCERHRRLGGLTTSGG
jgi:hypothetical protein